MEEYKGIVSKYIIGSYREVLVIDVMEDKLFQYKITNNTIVFNQELSYMDYLTNCQNFIYESDIDDYVESLSLSKLEK